MTNREKIMLDTIKEITAAQKDFVDGTIRLLNDMVNKLNDTGDV